MLVLLPIALLAGAGTALSPCVLPVLPALLSAGGVGGRRRPLGVVIGLALTFTINVLLLARVASGVGLGDDALRTIAVVVLIIAGLALLIPELAAWLERPLAPLTRLTPKNAGQGFPSGLVVGGAMGFVYTPCAGPILAAVTSVGAATGRTVPIALAYSAGTAVVLLALMLGGRGLLGRIRRAGAAVTVQRVLGVIVLATGVVIATNEDVRFDKFIAEHIPNVSLTASLERSHFVVSREHEITGIKPKFTAVADKPHPILPTSATSDARLALAADSLPNAGPAPAFQNTQDWFNTPGDRPLTMASLRGRVVLIDFWTYTCINCIRTLPYLQAWYSRYRNQGLTIIGVETPEFGFEHDAGNVANAIKQFGIKYPVVQDNDYAVWDSYGNEYWPADYLIDGKGNVRYEAFGEGDYSTTEGVIRELLASAGYPVPGAMAQPKDVITPSSLTTPETYLGTNRAQGWASGPFSGTHNYGTAPSTLPENEFAFSGTWTISGQPAVPSAGAGLDAEVHARNVYMVLTSTGNTPRQVQVDIDGHPAGAGTEGGDVHNGKLTVSGQRLYWLLSLPSDSTHRLSLRFPAGVTGYSFTFG
ncbi:MAG TPA: cytochrome c biogenesis protein DipZ [Solirubrobacteraceae bacterium]|nr:cytochrome c biogenesis protein DipZ [Solirubrobacteraceae bacterium]